jgi:hypothetical protein
MTVLVAAASQYGATTEIAAWIGAGLVANGVDVDVRKLNEVDDTERYDAFVLGSAVCLEQGRSSATHRRATTRTRCGLRWSRCWSRRHTRAITRCSAASSTRTTSACARRSPCAVRTRARATTATARRSTNGRPRLRASSSKVERRRLPITGIDSVLTIEQRGRKCGHRKASATAQVWPTRRA